MIHGFVPRLACKKFQGPIKQNVKKSLSPPQIFVSYNTISTEFDKMGSFKDPRKIQNKIKRKEIGLRAKRAKENTKRDDRLRRRRTEDRNPKLREERRARNVPATIDRKRTWDTADPNNEDDLGLAVDLASIKRRKVQEEEEAAEVNEDDAEEVAENDEDDLAKDGGEERDDDLDSMLDEDLSDDEKAQDTTPKEKPNKENRTSTRASSPAQSTATDMNLTPESLQARFPSLFEPLAHEPKVLITTSINSHLHDEASLLTSLFPNSTYIRRTAHFHGHKYSVREIASFASNRSYTALVILNEDLKRPSGLDVVHLPAGPMFHFSIANWVEGKRLPGHGNPTDHNPELILNGFKTPLGLLTAHLFKTMFPPQPELLGRQVVTLHNQRDYIFLRRHRYVFRDKRTTEKSIQGTDGKPVKGVEEIKAGLQELGPRFTLKLRRIDRGIQRASGQEWEWKAGSEKVRTRFQL